MLDALQLCTGIHEATPERDRSYWHVYSTCLSAHFTQQTPFADIWTHRIQDRSNLKWRRLTKSVWVKIAEPNIGPELNRIAWCSLIPPTAGCLEKLRPTTVLNHIYLCTYAEKWLLMWCVPRCTGARTLKVRCRVTQTLSTCRLRLTLDENYAKH